MRLLVANANTTEAITEACAAVARAAAAPGTEIIGATPRFGPSVIATRVENVIAGHALLEALAEQRRRRRWGIFFKLIALAYVTGLLILAGDWGSKEIGEGKRHTALVQMVGVIREQGEANAEHIKPRQPRPKCRQAPAQQPRGQPARRRGVESREAMDFLSHTARYSRFRARLAWPPDKVPPWH